MQRLARYFWSLSVGIIGFFVGMIFLGSYHTFDDWQVGLAGFGAALALAVPTYIGISRVAAKANRGGLIVLVIAGGLFFLVALAIYTLIAFH